MMEAYELIDNTEKNRYEYHVGKHIAKIEYVKAENGEIYLTHTEVPSELAGQGIGSALLGDVLQEIDRQQLRLIPVCPFVTGYVRKHPQWQRIVK